MYQVFLFIIFPLFSVLLYSFNIEFTFYGIKIIKFFLQYKKFDLTSVSLMNPNAGHFIKFRIHNVQIIKLHCIVLFPIKSRHIKLRTKIVLFAILSHFNFFFFKLNLNLFFLFSSFLNFSCQVFLKVKHKFVLFSYEKITNYLLFKNIWTNLEGSR